jgi:steroid delta-isomerase-like uncharacterized protein
MSTVENKDLIRRWYEQYDQIRNGNVDVADEFWTTDCVYHSAYPPDVHGIEALKQMGTEWFTAFPDYQPTNEEYIAEGDKVVVRQTMRFTHTGDLFGIPPTGKKVTMGSIMIFRIEGGKIAEFWERYDALGAVERLGGKVIPPQE